MPLDTLLHRRAADLFADALDLAAPEREALLNDSGIDPEVVAEVRSLLAVHDPSRRILSIDGDLQPTEPAAVSFLLVARSELDPFVEGHDQCVWDHRRLGLEIDAELLDLGTDLLEFRCSVLEDGSDHW